MTLLTQMREAAEKATKGERAWIGPNEAFLNLASPKNVLALLDALEEAERALDEGVLAEAFERTWQDVMGRRTEVPIGNMVGRHLAHHIPDVAKEFRAKVIAKINALKGEAS